MSVNLKSGVSWFHCFCKHGFEQNRAEGGGGGDRELRESMLPHGAKYPWTACNTSYNRIYKAQFFFSPTLSFIFPAIFLSVSIKVKTFKNVVNDNGRTDVQTDKSVPIIFLNTNIAQTGHGSLQVMFCFVFFSPLKYKHTSRCTSTHIVQKCYERKYNWNKINLDL